MIDEIEEETSLDESTPNPEAEKNTSLEELEESKTSANALPEDSTPAFMEGFRNSWGEKPTRKLVREIIETVLLALLVFMAIRVLVHNYQVDGLSMYPTLDNGEYVIVNKWSYSSINVGRFSNVIPGWTASSDSQEPIFGKIERGDIVVFKNPASGNRELIKRVIGLPGDTLEIVSGEVYIDGYALEEPYLNQQWRGDYPAITIPDDHIYVLGDNRNNSTDSRNISVGLIPMDNITGKAFFTYWPHNAFGPIKSEQPNERK